MVTIKTCINAMTSCIKTLLFNFLLIFFVIYANGQSHPTRDINNITDSLLTKSISYTQANPDSSIILANIAIDFAQESKNADQLQAIYHQLGYVYYNQNRFEQANKYFNVSLEIAKERGDLSGQALALNRLGNVSQLQTNYLVALDYYLEALELNTTISSKPEIARTLVNLANVYSVIGQYQHSIEHFLKAMDIHEELDEKEGLAWTSLGIARLFKRLDLLDRAMQYAETALKHYRIIEQETGNSVGVTLSLSEIGSIYHKLGNYDKALEYTQMVLEINKNTQNIYGQAANHISLGVIFLDRGNDQLARNHLSKAISLKGQVGDSLDLASLYRHLGKIEMRSNNPKLAHRYFTQSLDFAKKHRIIPDISEAYLCLSNIYSQLGDSGKALAAFKNHTNYKDSLNSSDIAKLEMQYEFEKREKEQELLTQQREALQQAKLERQRVVLIFFVVAFLLAGILSAFIFYAYREKNRINQLLVEQNIEISNQKEEIESQKEEIEQQRDFVTRQRDQIAEQQRLITDSITYASRIQNAVLPSQNTMQQLPWESFVLYKPKNIVSGDFYWTSQLDNGKIMIAAADCTGHGVPGAFMSMLGITLLRDIVSRETQVKPASILSQMRDMVLLSLNQEKGKIDQADGMDMAIAIIDPQSLEMEFAGAYLSAMIVRTGAFELDEISTNYRLAQKEGVALMEMLGDKMPIGHHVLGNKPFSNKSFQLQKGDMLYLYSDGYADQFGGPKNIKFLMQNFRELLLTVHHHSCHQQKDVLQFTIEEYKGENKQVDDMLVMGVRIN
jgi:serine phosphatase RsbU (regulator of sigma subunit)/Tfp pilus assembly protein PilF